jgi:exopolyphosphatase/guanosine-5'-triphosphate,3'-diphosphate pyrophosphatase
MTATRRTRNTIAAPRYAIIDIGTNSVKLVVAGADLVPTYFERETTRLGRGLSGGGRIGKPALDATARSLRQFVRTARARGAHHVFAFSTYAMRRSAGAAGALDRLQKEAGIAVRILTGREEASFSYLSAHTHIPHPKPWALVCDVGGGSTELVLAKSGKVVALTSKPLGALHLTERFIDSDPIDMHEFGRLVRHVGKSVGGWVAGRPEVPPARLDLVVSGGSVTTLAAMLGGDEVMRAGALAALERRCLSLTTEARKRIPGLPPDRADIIPAGIAVVRALMRATGKRTLRVNPGGVREGALIHLLQNSLEW